MSLVDKVTERFKEKGLKEGAKDVLKAAGSRVVDANREVILMRLDLANPKAHRKPKEIAKYDFEMQRFGPKLYDKVRAMLRASEPERIEQLQMRIDADTPGFVVLENGEVVFYVFYEENAPSRPKHPDLEWLGIELRDKEIYSFDSFIPIPLRGRGIPMFRATYQALYEAGYETAYGYVWAWDTAPLFSYRVTGWETFHRFTEHRIGGRLAVVSGVLYKINRFDRTRLVKLPMGGLLHPKDPGMMSPE